MGAPIVKERLTGQTVKADVRKADGSKVRTVDLDPQLFSHVPNVPLMHQVVNAQLAARRAGTQNTKTRAEVAGGGSKPWRQKGTGRARQGSTNAPNFVGGGVARGPKPRSYKQHTPKKMIRLALLSALSDRAADGKVIVVSGLSFDKPSTKGAADALKAWDVNGAALIVLGDDDENTYLSFRNIPKVHVVHAAELNAYDVLRHDFIVFTEATLPSSEAPVAEAAPAPKKAAAKPKAAADEAPAEETEA